MRYKVGRCLLSNLLRSKGMNQQQLADILRVSKQQISNYTTNTNIIPLVVAKNIAEVLNCNINDLYVWIEVNNDKDE